MYDDYKIKAKHFLVFWTLYNDIGISDDAWTAFTRRDLARAIKKSHPQFVIAHLTSILETLARGGYLELKRGGDRTIGTGVQIYELRIHPQAWQRKARKYIQVRTPEQQARYDAARKIRMLAKR